MLEIRNYGNGEIFFSCKCGMGLVVYCEGVGNTGIAVCDNCARKYIGVSCVNVDELPERDIKVLQKKISSFESEMRDLITRKEEIQTGIYQLSVDLTKARGLLCEEARNVNFKNLKKE